MEIVQGPTCYKLHAHNYKLHAHNYACIPEMLGRWGTLDPSIVFVFEIENKLEGSSFP